MISDIVAFAIAHGVTSVEVRRDVYEELEREIDAAGSGAPHDNGEDVITVTPEGAEPFTVVPQPWRQ